TLLIMMRIMGLRMPSDRHTWIAFFNMGLLNNVLPFSLIVWGQTHVASGVASILNATTPMFTVIVAHWLTTDEKITKRSLFGIGFGFAGVAIMVGGDALHGLSFDVLAPIAILGAALSYAFAGVFGRRFKTMGVSPMATATGQVIASSILLAPLVMVVDQPWRLPIPSLSAWGALVGLATVSTALAYIIYFRVLESAGATNLLLVTFLIPVSAVLLGIGFLGEVLLSKHLLGMVLISIGLVAIDGRLWALFSSRKPVNKVL
ncbi:MAG: DMT family transporter, partial [Gammaproteobacteria bacterium]|nr:DMT family transporter [Gammaproteobacteria bacterium]